MATRSIIAKTQPSGKIKASYCHFDGYPEHNGKILASYYTDKKKINSLLAEGEISVLGRNIGEKIDFDDYQLCHALNQCRFYHRDRGEKLVLEVLEDQCELESYGNNDCMAEYIYLFREGEWYILGCSNDYELLEERLTKLNK
jgi:hypothetical protein